MGTNSHGRQRKILGLTMLYISGTVQTEDSLLREGCLLRTVTEGVWNEPMLHHKCQFLFSGLELLDLDLLLLLGDFFHPFIVRGFISYYRCRKNL